MEIISFVGGTASGFGERKSYNSRKYKKQNYWGNKNTRREKSSSVYSGTSLVYSRNPAVRISRTPATSFSDFKRKFALLKFDVFNSTQEILKNIDIAARKAFSLFWLVPAVVGVIAVPFFAINLFKYSLNHTSPLALRGIDSVQDELEFLNKAMEKFALEGLDFTGFDENGNVLGKNGEILTAKQVGITETVTFQTYKVKAGESISTIAKKFGLTNISTLISINDISNVRSLREGQKLTVPSSDGLIHYVKSGERLEVIAKNYGTEIGKILDANDLDSQNLKIGQKLFIPGAKMDSAALKKALGETWIMPLKASFRWTSMFGRREDPFSGVKTNHTGVDMACPTGTPIKAVRGGKVIKAGVTGVYGNYVIIAHEEGYQTLYAHMSKINAKQGQTVNQGTVIGLVGSTGYSTGPHLHFSLYKNGKLMDPMTILRK